MFTPMSMLFEVKANGFVKFDLIAGKSHLWERKREAELDTVYAIIQSVAPLNCVRMFLASESIKNWK